MNAMELAWNMGHVSTPAMWSEILCASAILAHGGSNKKQLAQEGLDPRSFALEACDVRRYMNNVDQVSN